MDERLREQTSLNNRQLGFRKGVGTREAIVALAGLVASSKARKLPLLAAFIYFSKAFDKVPQEVGVVAVAQGLGGGTGGSGEVYGEALAAVEVKTAPASAAAAWALRGGQLVSEGDV
uniref:Reverse transcriptase domain-containing protein n=1 Tax=Chromera velia CCMP2878 TaxID=1169474 RepID=A0A0G4G737_9ALVE|eukprot:Cvel_20464.t1-p1 / transcript=Cvel_20464.t1 / gene=Cvel_20464 / organism=Chromera_velia_CCMP2878 / gene_product=hypothetical protein / transcript_product=hypothetical protein / location=Cvel_scaffold1838:5571-14075(+) / protein_length=116 / sequence_SO=supercontig / SO=protein_coding / is_pseudo=false